MRWKKTFLPPDFGGAHPSDPRLHVQFYAYYFRDTTLAPDNQERRTLSMRCLSLLAVLGFLALGCAHRPPPVSAPSSTASFPLPVTLVAYDPGQTPPYFPALVAKSEDVNGEGRGDLSADAEAGEERMLTIADPLEPFNRAMFQFNDKLYFWVLKPVAQGYNKVVPERARVGVNDFFTNLRFPVRFVNCLLQVDFGCAGRELGRFVVNTIWGVGGLLDPASNKQLDIPKGNADLDQTLGLYGVGPGFYIVWPVLGPSSARDTARIVGDFFLYPVSYIRPWYDWLAVRAYEEVNDTSLRIGDYESLKEAAIDPYVGLRDAFAQHRRAKVEAAKRKLSPTRPEGTGPGEPSP
jgi:phospholipid-binding lipoprotein MlaA